MSATSRAGANSASFTTTITTNTDWILVTGQPGCGKTTAVKKMVSLLENAGIRCQGFYTEEVRDSSSTRIGFDVVTVPDGERGVLARKGGPKRWPKTGAYSVDVSSFERLALSSFQLPKTTNDNVDEKKNEGGTSENSNQLSNSSNRNNNNNNNNNSNEVVYVLDEIGRMELHSKEFPRHVRSMLQNGVRLVGAVTAPRYGNRVPFCDDVTKMPGVQVHNLTKTNRDEVVSGLLEDISKRWIICTGSMP